PNEPNAVVFNYYLKEDAGSPVKMTISDPDGEILGRLEGQTGAGINRVFWNMRRQRSGEQAQSRRRSGPLVNPGDYIVSMEVNGKTLSQKFRITERKGWPIW
ncbi:unnamed protein product, partial [marine sediment metagenome]